MKYQFHLRLPNLSVISSDSFDVKVMNKDESYTLRLCQPQLIRLLQKVVFNLIIRPALCETYGSFGAEELQFRMGSTDLLNTSLEEMPLNTSMYEDVDVVMLHSVITVNDLQ